MFRYFVRRVLIAIPILLIGTFISFIAVASSGDPLGSLRMKPGITQATINQTAHDLGLDQPILSRYWHWLTSFVRGDWGYSVAVGQGKADVKSTVLTALWNTSRLVVGAEVIALIIGAAIGVLAAMWQYSIFDYIATGVAFLMFSMPLFCVAILLENFGISLNQFLESIGISHWITLNGPPVDGFTGGFGHQIFQYTGTFILPTITLMLISFAAYSRFQRASMLETMNMDYVRTARAKGLSSGRVVFRHAMRNALIPITTLFALNFGSTFGGAIITENVFNWQGMGKLLVTSVEQYDPPMLMGWLVVTGALVILFNLLADLVYSYLDPRIRLG
ncbi:MAG: ABC transporter permease [Sciscionella sp.]|nr:ABC transporter permease [Sciscionella sp.]